MHWASCVRKMFRDCISFAYYGGLRATQQHWTQHINKIEYTTEETRQSTFAKTYYQTTEHDISKNKPPFTRHIYKSEKNTAK